MTHSELAELRYLMRIAVELRQRAASQCDGKHKFADYITARGTLSRTKLIHQARPYRCDCCDGWHIGGIVSQRAKRLMFGKKRG